MAKKLQSSLAVEGELPEDGLAAYGDDGGRRDDLMLALARKIVNGDEDEAETVEAVFAAARDAETTAEEYLVDDGWKSADVEPVVFDTGCNGWNLKIWRLSPATRPRSRSSCCSPGRSSWPMGR